MDQWSVSSNEEPGLRGLLGFVIGSEESLRPNGGERSVDGSDEVNVAVVEGAPYTL